jgi:hypothetical protein
LSENLSSDQDEAALKELEEMENEMLKSKVEDVKIPDVKLEGGDKVEEGESVEDNVEDTPVSTKKMVAV